METKERCFACNRPLKKAIRLVTTNDGQRVNVGWDCAEKIDRASKAGYQPPLGGPRLYSIGYSPSGN